MGAARAIIPADSEASTGAPLLREAVALVLAGWSGFPVAEVESILPQLLDREVVRASAAAWLDALRLKPTAERIDALVHVGERRESRPRTRAARG